MTENLSALETTSPSASRATATNCSKASTILSVASGTDAAWLPEPKQLLRRFAGCLGGTVVRRPLPAQLLDLHMHLGRSRFQLGDRDVRCLDVLVDEGRSEVVDLLTPTKRLRQRVRTSLRCPYISGFASMRRATPLKSSVITGLRLISPSRAGEAMLSPSP